MDRDCFNCNPVCHNIHVNASGLLPVTFPVIAKTSLALFVIAEIHVVLSFLLFAYLNKRYLRLSMRSVSLAFVVSVGVTCEMIAGPLEQGLVIPCAPRVSTGLAVVPILGTALVVRLTDYLNRNVYSRALVKHLNNVEYESSTSSPSSNENKLQNEDMSMLDKLIRSERGILVLKNLASYKGRVGLTFFLIVPFFIASTVEWVRYPQLSLDGGCRACSFTKAQRDLIVAAGAILTLFAIAIAWIARKYPDPYFILTEIKIYAFGGIISLIGFQASGMVRDGQISPYFSIDWLTWLGMMIIQFMTCTWQIYRALKDEKIGSNQSPRVRDETANVDVVSVSPGDNQMSSSVQLRQHLEKGLGDLELQAFEKYLTSEFSVENLRMYLECQQWETAYFDMTDQSKRSRAKKIIGYFVERDSLFNVNLPGTVREELIRRTNDLSSPIPKDVFEAAKKEVFFMLLGSYIRYTKRIKAM